MTDRPAFSVIIPLYKSEAYLAETLASVLRQTHPPLEILAIDDGSPDRSGDIARSFGERVTVIRQENGGVSAARNLGTSRARGSWLAFLDADDIWEPGYLAEHAAAIRQTPSAQLCYSGRRHLTQTQNAAGFHLGPPVPVPGLATVRATILERAPFTPSAVTIERSTLLAVGGFNGRHNSVEDWDLWIRLACAGAIFAHCPEPLLHYRIHMAACTNNPLPVLDRSLGVVRETLLPRLPARQHRARGRRIMSRLEGEAAILLRENGLPGALPRMLHSIVTHPLHDPRRYKIAAHMLLARTRRTGSPAAV